MKTFRSAPAFLGFLMIVAVVFGGIVGRSAEKDAAQASAPVGKAAATFSSLDFSAANDEMLPAGTVALAEADFSAAFALYEKLSRRSVIPGDKLPAVKLSYRIEAPMARREVLQALDTLLSQYGVTMIVMGTNFMKAMNEALATREGAPEVSLPAAQLPDSNTYIQYLVRLQNRGVNSAVPLLMPLSHLPNSILTMPSSNSIIIRDYSANVRRMLSVIQKYDVPDDGQVFEEPPRKPFRPKN